jgi:hypothetical protein
MADEKTIDQLQIEITSRASGATKSIRTLATNMEKLGSSLGNIAPQLESISNSITNLSNVSGKTNISIKNATSGMKQFGSETSKTSSKLSLLKDVGKSIIGSNNNVGKSYSSLASKIGLFYANYGLLMRGMSKVGTAAKSFTDYIEAFNFFDVASNSIAAQGDWKTAGYESAEAYANGFKEQLTAINAKMSGFTQDALTGDIDVSGQNNLGIDISALTGYEAELTSLGASLGVTTDNTLAMSKALTMLAGDMSSLHNIDLDTVMTNFSSGIIGQSRALYKYGIDITNANLQQIAYEHGVEKSVSAMSQSEKVQLRLLAILQQSTDAWGDLANTINQPANQLRKLTIGIKNVGMMLGKLLLPIVSSILPYLNAAVTLAQRLLAYIARLTGVKIDFSNMGSAASGIYDVDDALDDTSDSIDTATKKAKELNKQIRGFDKLNVINTASSSGSSGSGSGSGGSFDLSNDIAAALADYEKVWNEAFANAEDKATELANRIEKKFKEHDYKGLGEDLGKAIRDGLDSIEWEKVYTFANNFGTGLAEFLNGLISPETFSSVASTIAGALNTALQFKNGFLTTFDFSGLGDSIAAAINTFFEEYDFDTLGENAALWFNGIGDTIGHAMDNIDWGEVLSGFFEGIGSFFSTLDVDGAMALIGYLSLTKGGKTITKALGTAIFGADGIWATSIKKIFVNMSEASVEAAASGAIGETVSETVAGDIAAAGGAGALAGALDVGFTLAVGLGIALLLNYELQDDETGTTRLKNQIKKIEDWIGNIRVDWHTVTGFDGFEHEVSVPLKEKFKILKEDFRNGLHDIEDNIATAWSDFWSSTLDLGSYVFDFSWTKQWFSDAADAFKQAWEDIKDGSFVSAGGWILEGILDGFVGAFTFIAEPIAKFFEKVIEGICDVFGIHSPAKEMKPYGEYILKGILKGFTDAFSFIGEAVSGAIKWFEKGWDDVGDWFDTNVWDPVSTAASDTWDSITSSVSDATSSARDKMSTFKDNITEKWSTLKSDASSKWADIKNSITGKLSDAATTGASKMEDLKSRIRSKWDEAKSYVQSRLDFGQLRISLPDILSKLSDMIARIRERISNFTSTFRIKTPHISIGSKQSAFGFSYPTFDIQYYKKGGFPDMGSLMVAGEAGAEMVGNINGRTGVASNAEITGIRDSVESVGEQQNRLLAEQNKLLRQILAKDSGINSDELFSVVQSKARSYTNRTGNPAFT